MFHNRAIIFALDAIIRAQSGAEGYHWLFDPRLPGLLKDCRATGHFVFGLLDPSRFGLLLADTSEASELAEYINHSLFLQGGTPFDAIHISTDLSDPHPLWAWKRRFGFSLSQTTVVGYGAPFTQLRRNAGLGGVHWSPNSTDEIFRPSQILGF